MPKTDAVPENYLRCVRNAVRFPWNKLKYVSLIGSKTLRCRSRQVGRRKGRPAARGFECFMHGVVELVERPQPQQLRIPAQC